MGSTIQRIKQYIDFKGISVRKFEENVGFSNGSFASQFKNRKTIGVDRVENILHTYPEINAEWLLTGRGEMLKKGDLQIVQNGNNNINKGHNISENKNKIKSNVVGVDNELLEIIRKKDEQIDRLLGILEKK